MIASLRRSVKAKSLEILAEAQLLRMGLLASPEMAGKSGL
jgi:hypothetical protein